MNPWCRWGQWSHDAMQDVYLWMGPELKVHSLRISFCLSSDTLLEAYTSTQSLLVELRLETESRLLWLLPKPATRGSKNSTRSAPLKTRCVSITYYCSLINRKWSSYNIRNIVATSDYFTLITSLNKFGTRTVTEAPVNVYQRGGIGFPESLPPWILPS